MKQYHSLPSPISCIYCVHNWLVLILFVLSVNNDEVSYSVMAVREKLFVLHVS